jgi:recombination protein RecA
MTTLATLDQTLLNRLKQAKTPVVVDYDRPPRISSGSLALDAILGGGWPLGMVSMIWGPDNLGKSTLGFMALAEATHRGGFAALIDVERKVDPIWMEKLGVDLARCARFRPLTGEEGLQLVLTLLGMKEENGRNTFSVIVIDSIAAMTFSAENEGDMQDFQMALGARKVAQWCRKLADPLALSTTALLVINQATEKMNASKYEDPEKPKMGRQLGHTAAIRVKMLAKQKIEGEKGKLRGFALHPKIEKNQTYPNDPPRQTLVNLLVEGERVGLDLLAELTMVGKQFAIFTNAEGAPISGSQKWYFEGEPLAVGEAAVRKLLGERPELRERVEAELRARFDDLANAPKQEELPDYEDRPQEW